MVIADFSLQDKKFGKIRFCKLTMLVLEMPFFILSNADIRSAQMKLLWNSWKRFDSANRPCWLIPAWIWS